MDVIFLGGFYSPARIQYIIDRSRGRMMFANHNFDLAFFSGLLQQDGICLETIVVPGVGSYPYNYKDIYIKREIFEVYNVKVSSVGFFNLALINKLSLIINTAIELKRKINKCKDNKVELIISTATFYQLLSVFLASFFTKKKVVKTLIIQDIPLIMNAMSKTKTLKLLLRNWLDKIGLSLIKNCDYFVPLTAQMMNYLGVNKPFTVVEGIMNINDNTVIKPINTTEDLSKDIILYTGSVKRCFNIQNLIKAYQMIKRPNLELWICGSGDMDNELTELAQKDSNFKYFGLVNNGLVKEMQQKATILINPRSSDGEFTKYSFPSKTIEYLLSGKSVIMNKLPGVPDEYYKYIYVPIDESVDSMAKIIKEVLNMDKKERNDRAKRAQEFIIDTKNAKAQVKKVFTMIQKV